MGLDIYAYSKLQKLDCVFDECGEPIDATTRKPFQNCVFLHPNQHYIDRAAGLSGWYQRAGCFHVKAGSYGWYSKWRDWLAEISGWPISSYELYGKQWPSHAASAWAAESGPFWELINFSDCAGAIGGKHCQKLLDDFVAFQSKAEKENGRFFEKYQEWRKAFEVASNAGAVKFC